MSSSARCRRRARARFRNSDCARWPKKSNPAFAGYLAAFAGSAYIAVKEPAMARTAARKPKSLSKPAGFAEEAQPFLHEDIMRGVPAKRVQELIDKGVLAEKTVYRVIPERTFKRRLANREALRISEGDAIARMVRITEEAEQIFGDKAFARDWLVLPNPVLK